MARAALVAAVMCAVGIGFATPAYALAPGDFDPSFGTGGLVLTQLGAGTKPTSDALSIALQPDGKIIAAGDATESGGRSALLVARLNTDGSLDPSFGTGGKVLVQLGAGTTPSSDAYAIAVQPDGKIVVVGDATDSGGHPAFLVARLDSDGTFDSSFWGGGKTITQFGQGTTPSSDADAVALQPDGRIVVAGEATDSAGREQFLVEGLRSDGSPDSSFGSGAVVTAQLGAGATPYSYAVALALQPDGKIVVGGAASDSGGNNQFLAVRLSDKGSFDSSFGTAGKVITQVGTHPSISQPYSYVSAIALQPDGRIVATGGATTIADPAGLAMVARLNSDGTFDPSFGTGGTATLQLAPAGVLSYADAIALQADGKIVLAGAGEDNGNNAFAAARLDSAGSLDPSFGSGGKVATQLGAGTTNPSSFATGLALQADGRIVVAGGATDSSTNTQILVARLLGAPPPPTTSTPPPKPGPVTTPAPPRLTHVSQSHARWREGTRLPRIARVRRPPLGTVFRFKLNERSRIRFTFARKLPGRRAGKRCVAQTKHNKHRRRCTRTVGAGALSFTMAAGSHSLRFQGRLSKHRRLRPGRYTLTITAVNAAGKRSRSRPLTFTIVEPSARHLHRHGR